MSHRLKYVKVNEIEDLVVNNKEMIGVNIYFVWVGIYGLK